LVIRAGKKLIVTTAEVVHLDADGKESPCALMQQTIAVVQQRY
jgi:acyl-coenzyme A thioesterase PaaI-like protein